MHPLAPLLKSLGMARRAESPGAAGEHQEPLLATIRTSYAGKSATGVAALEVTLHDFFDDRPEVAVLPLEAGLILDQLKG